MTEEEWQTCTDPTLMLEFLRGKASDRKLRLFACACCRQFQKRLADKHIRRVIEVVEAFAEGVASQAQLVEARNVEQQPKHWPTFWAAANDDAFVAARLVQHNANYFSLRRSGNRAATFHASLLRDIFCKPFHPVTTFPIWFTPTVVSLAEAIYAEKAFDRLPILADAMEEADCDNADILNHCRGEGPHVRGCWVVDLLLGKS